MQEIILGLAARIPLLNGRVVNRGTGGTDRADYCYGVWLKHLALLRDAGISRVPRRVGELGPGDSLGVGLAAVLCGADSYLALDVKRFSNPARNARILDELVTMFRTRAPRPTRGWPDFDHCLDDGLFPSGILNETHLGRTLAEERIQAIREALRDEVSRDGSIQIRYVAPWEDEGAIEPKTVDLILSHSVLEHVRDVDRAYAACAEWIAPQGWMSHQIDLTSHGLARRWNGSWGIRSDLYWELIAGKRDCWINRLPASAHLTALKRAGFALGTIRRRTQTDGLSRHKLGSTWQKLTDEDLTCAGLFLHARPLSATVAG